MLIGLCLERVRKSPNNGIHHVWREGQNIRNKFLLESIKNQISWILSMRRLKQLVLHLDLSYKMRMVIVEKMIHLSTASFRLSKLVRVNVTWWPLGHMLLHNITQKACVYVCHYAQKVVPHFRDSLHTQTELILITTLRPCYQHITIAEIKCDVIQIYPFTKFPKPVLYINNWH